MVKTSDVKAALADEQKVADCCRYAAAQLADIIMDSVASLDVEDKHKEHIVTMVIDDLTAKRDQFQEVVKDARRK